MVFSGGAFAWLIMLPILSNGYNNSTTSIINDAYDIWNTKIRYIGVGAMLVGGIWSLLSVVKFLIIIDEFVFIKKLKFFFM